jgi:hypothetical protein
LRRGIATGAPVVVEDASTPRDDGCHNIIEQTASDVSRPMRGIDDDQGRRADQRRKRGTPVP